MPSERAAGRGESNRVARRPQLSGRPGSLLAWLVFEVTGAPEVRGCHCEGRRRAMDRWGWTGCWRHRVEILGWIASEARLRGHRVDERHVFDLMKAAFVEVARRGQVRVERRSRSEIGS